jgi:hypothetical protein
MTYLLNVGLRTKSPQGLTTALAFIMFASLLIKTYMIGSIGAKEPVVLCEPESLSSLLLAM